MLKKIISDKFVQRIADGITKSLEGTLAKFQNDSDVKMDKILTHVEALRLELKSLDERVTHKEIKDHATYGQVQYKINSLHSEVLQRKLEDQDAKNAS